uniref:Granulins domain-containing protein n=1 Tax=Chromera velia CCMP2878 TaxID=1169474 RepID=A0A0G4HBD8_9ALVE|eukprot:Cvel_917.t1-p1 / transcript=Cvel_917.t1 / gene=Cvel_917 / organism=Chromera_velia_CCMP2878 / gene_product=hypothetical protein / transcript_product=hypothetical protein / location=Cvel_scaffold29:53521-53967(-) / protein_length=149 / sequence_SO=supercontig / SO=protein_coding / is_pseudo=false
MFFRQALLFCSLIAVARGNSCESIDDQPTCVNAFVKKGLDCCRAHNTPFSCLLRPEVKCSDFTSSMACKNSYVDCDMSCCWDGEVCHNPTTVVCKDFGTESQCKMGSRECGYRAKTCQFEDKQCILPGPKSEAEEFMAPSRSTEEAVEI